MLIASYVFALILKTIRLLQTAKPLDENPDSPKTNVSFMDSVPFCYRKRGERGEGRGRRGGRGRERARQCPACVTHDVYQFIVTESGQTMVASPQEV